jgi:UrcA family protein
MKELNLGKLLLVASVALVFSAPIVANAAHNSLSAVESGIRVSYSDLNLDSRNGIEVLYKRLQNATNQACLTGPFQQKASVREVVNARACYNDVLTRSVAKVGNNELTAVHES